MDGDIVSRYTMILGNNVSKIIAEEDNGRQLL